MMRRAGPTRSHRDERVRALRISRSSQCEPGKSTQALISIDGVLHLLEQPDNRPSVRSRGKRPGLSMGVMIDNPQESMGVCDLRLMRFVQAVSGGRTSEPRVAPIWGLRVRRLVPKLLGSESRITFRQADATWLGNEPVV